MSRRQRNTYFQCRQFRIEQGQTAMKVTTDACVLGSWPNLEGARRILDIGAGTGLLSLFAAQRNSQAQIDAVEFDAAAAQQAHANFSASPWPDRLRLINTDIQHYSPEDLYDRILCNPPFFSDSTRNNCVRLAKARHDDSLPPEALLDCIVRFLTTDGTAYVLLPIPAAQRIAAQAGSHGLHLRHQLDICSQAGDPPHRAILGLGLQPGESLHESLTLYTTHPIHTRAASQLFAPFYTRLRSEVPELES